MINKITGEVADEILSGITITKNEDGEILIVEYNGENGSIDVVKNTADFRGELDFSILIKCNNGKKIAYYTTDKEMIAFMFAIAQFFNIDEMAENIDVNKSDKLPEQEGD